KMFRGSDVCAHFIRRHALQKRRPGSNLHTLQVVLLASSFIFLHRLVRRIFLCQSFMTLCLGLCLCCFLGVELREITEVATAISAACIAALFLSVRTSDKL